MCDDRLSVSTAMEPPPLWQHQHTCAELVNVHTAVAPLAGPAPDLHLDGQWEMRDGR